jgi:hypothetical protein
MEGAVMVDEQVGRWGKNGAAGGNVRQGSWLRHGVYEVWQVQVAAYKRY